MTNKRNTKAICGYHGCSWEQILWHTDEGSDKGLRRHLRWWHRITMKEYVIENHRRFQGYCQQAGVPAWDLAPELLDSIKD